MVTITDISKSYDSAPEPGLNPEIGIAGHSKSLLFIEYGGLERLFDLLCSTKNLGFDPDFGRNIVPVGYIQ